MASIKIAALLITILIAQVYSLEQEVYENDNVCIQCNSKERIQIISASWDYDRLSRNVLTPNIRNLAYWWGTYLGMCSYDVKNFVTAKCGYDNKCCFTPTRALLGDCGYHMYLRIEYFCEYSADNTFTLSDDLNCSAVSSNFCTNNPHPFGQYNRRRKRQGPSTSNYCASHHTIDQRARALENDPQLLTQHPTNMDAVTSITTRDYPRRNGTRVNLVYVMRARISRNTLRRREGYPAGIEARMIELDRRETVPTSQGDDRGHILASSLGGPRNVLNIVPQDPNLNRMYAGHRSMWYDAERLFTEMINDHPGIQIDWTLVITYGNLHQDNLRPTEFGLCYVYHFGNGTSVDNFDWFFSNDGTICSFY